MPTTDADKLGIISGVLMLIGGFLPWISYSASFYEGVSGFETTNGFRIIAISIISLLLIFYNVRSKRREKIPNYLIMIFGVISALLMLLSFRGIRGNAVFKIESGFYIAVGGAFMLLISGIWNASNTSIYPESKPIQSVSSSANNDPVTTLKMRLAKGEITKGEYEELLRLLTK